MSKLEWKKKKNLWNNYLMLTAEYQWTNNLMEIKWVR